MLYRVEVTIKDGFVDARGDAITEQAGALGVSGVERVSVGDLYFLMGDLSAAEVETLVQTVLVDPVVEDVRWGAMDALAARDAGGAAVVEVALRPGVTDPVAETLMQGAKLAGIDKLAQAATGQRYEIRHGGLGADAIRRIASGLLANDVIERFSIDEPVEPGFVEQEDLSADDVAAMVEIVPILEADDADLMAVSQVRRLSLNLQEMRQIQAHYATLGREPNDVELEMLAQTWSEHCVHKTFRAEIAYEERSSDGETLRTETIGGLLKQYIRGATEKVNKPWVHSAFVDNAGIVAFDDEYDLAFKVETHNHPSALDPFGGANTGVGGVIRDVIGVSARPIANTDVLCFGPLDMPFEELPEGVLHPKRIADGVIHGIEDYGNKMGIPTVNGTILYEPGYTANPLVYCGCLGVLPVGSHPTDPQKGDQVIVIGGRTGRDGLRGATFSSMEMDHSTGDIAGSAVQIGHPIHEKAAMEAVMVCRDEKLYNAVTDCGAGGLSSAVGEMGEELGATIQLERVPLKYPGLAPWEIWLSEAQERMVMAVPADKWPRVKAICDGLDVEATNLGEFTGDGLLHLYYGEHPVAEIQMAFLHDGGPQRHMDAVWAAPEATEPELTVPARLDEALLGVLATHEVRSKEETVRRYDHEVQGGTVIKPLTGAGTAGPNGAAVLVPLDVLEHAGHPRVDGDRISHTRGCALSVGINPFYGVLDPYCMAWAAVDEAMRNVVAVGADPDQTCILDNFCWGNPSLRDRLGSLVRCTRGCHDAAVAFGTPFVSGKDSLNNEYTGIDGQKHAIPGTILISALGIVPDVRNTVGSDLKTPGNLVYAVGTTRDELGASIFYRSQGLTGANVPQPPESALEMYRAMFQAISAGLVRSCQDCSEGGVAVAAADMVIGGRIGMDLDLAALPHPEGFEDSTKLLFSESLGRFLVEITPENAAAFEEKLAGFPIARVGVVNETGRLVIQGTTGQPIIDSSAAELEKAWRGHVM